MWYGWNDGGIWMILGGLLSLGFLVGIVLLIIWAVSQINKRPAPVGGADNAMNIARERYARGEITQQQFDEIKRNLGP